MSEIWKDVVGYEGFYQVSNLGRVRSCERYVPYYNANQTGKRVYTKKHIKSKILKPCEYYGYYCVSLYNANHKMKLCKIHRLVMQAFCGNSDLTVNHINGVKTDNRLENLEYLSIADNTYHAIRTGLRNTTGENNPRAKLSKNDVVDIRVRKLNNEPLTKVFNLYSDKISLQSFKAVWYNQTWKSVII